MSPLSAPISAGLRISNWPPRHPSRRMEPCLPAGLAQARNVATHRRNAQLVAAQAELAVDAARTAGNGATVALARRRGIARQLLQLHRRFHLLLEAGRLAADGLL